MLMRILPSSRKGGAAACVLALLYFSAGAIFYSVDARTATHFLAVNPKDADKQPDAAVSSPPAPAPEKDKPEEQQVIVPPTSKPSRNFVDGAAHARLAKFAATHKLTGLHHGAGSEMLPMTELEKKQLRPNDFAYRTPEFTAGNKRDLEYAAMVFRAMAFRHPRNIMQIVRDFHANGFSKQKLESFAFGHRDGARLRRAGGQELVEFLKPPEPEAECQLSGKEVDQEQEKQESAGCTAVATQ